MRTYNLRIGDLIRFKGSNPVVLYEVISVKPLTTKPWLKWQESDLDHVDVYRKVDEDEEETSQSLVRRPQ